MSRPRLPDAVIDGRVMAIVRGLDPDRVMEIASVVHDAGIGVVEVTMDSPAAPSSIEQLANSEVVVGAGTVVSIAEAELAVQAGARFLVAPHTDRTVIGWAGEHGYPMIPGAFTATEIVAAWDAGASAVKVFPASIGGPGLIRALKGPYGTLPLIPTGGITADNAAAYLEAGALAVGLGGWLTGHPDLEVIAERAVATVRACRN